MKMHVGSVLFCSFVSGTLSFILPMPKQNYFKFTTRIARSLTNISPSPELIKSVDSGIKLAIDQCEKDFKEDARWNCPASAFSGNYRYPFNREIAYVQAMRAAGIVHAVTNSCANNEIIGCGCNFDHNGNMTVPKIGIVINNNEVNEVAWILGKCTDNNTDFAEKVVNHTLMDLEYGKDVQAHLTRHNNFIGKRMVQNTMIKQCQCDEKSKDCSVQVCVIQIAPFEKVAKSLKMLYYSAQAIPMSNALRVSTNDIERSPNQLLYLIESKS